MKPHNTFLRSRWGRGLVWLMIGQIGFFQCLPAYALPRGESVTHGDVTFTRAGNRLLVNQATGKAIVNYHSFDIGALETVQFAQPGATASILNRVVGGASSEIAGSLLANGNVYLINPQGILFSSSARVNVGGLVASAMPMADSDFLAGRLFFSGPGGSVINDGELSGRFVYLIGADVQNRGTIAASEVVLAAGKRSVLIDEAAGGQIRLVIDDEIEVVESEEELADALQEDPADANVELAGVDEADGVIDPVADDAATDLGLDIAAEDTTAETVLDELAGLQDVAVGELPAGGEIDVPLADGSPALDAGTVVNEGIVDASGLSGGTISLGGVGVQQAGELHADGTVGDGGLIRVVGEDYVVATAGSLTTANAGTDGTGGDIRFLSPEATGVDAGARIEARGGAQSGDGGFVEVSGTQYVQMEGRADLRAENGESGTLLIDPADVEIRDQDGTGSFLGGDWQTGDSPSILFITDMLDQLQLGNVVVNTSVGNTGVEGVGNITVFDAIQYATGTTDGLGIGTGNSLDLIADTDILIQAAITGGGALGQDLALNLDATGNVVISDTIDTGGAAFSSSGAGFDASLGSVDAGGGQIDVQHTGAVQLNTLQTSGGAGGIAVQGSDIALAADLTTDNDTTLTATAGGISQSGGTITADGLALQATDGIGDASALQTAVNTLAADNSATGAIQVQNDTGGSALTIGGVGGIAGIANAGGGITVVNQGALVVDSAVTATGGGDVALTAAGANDADVLTINANVSASGGDGSIALTAGDSIEQTAGDVTAAGAGDITYTASTGTASGAITMTAGRVESTTGAIQFNAEGNIDLLEVLSGGGSVSVNGGAGSVTVGAGITTGGGDFSARGESFDNSGGGDITTGGGAIDIAMNDQVTIGSDLVSGGAVNGGAISVVASNNTTMAAGGGLSVNALVSSSLPDPGSGTLTIGAGTTILGGATFTVGDNDILLSGGALDLIINTAHNFNNNTALVALRDVIIDNVAVTSAAGIDLTIEADTDGLTNADGLGTAFGGVLVQGAGGSISSAGSLVIRGTELLDVGGAPSSVSLAGAANTVSAMDNILIEGKAIAPAGSDLNLSGAVTSTAGSITILSTQDIEQNANLTASGSGQTIDVESTGGSVSMAAGAASTATDGNIRYVADQDVILGALDAGTGSASVTAANGSIRDFNGVAINVTAAEARFSAGDAVGDLSLDDRLETMVDTVSAEAGAGGIGLEETDGVTVGSVAAVTVNRVLSDGTTLAESDAGALAGLTTTTDGSVVQLAGAGALVVDEAVLADGAGNILLSNAGGTVSLNSGSSSGSGSIQIAANGGVTQAATGDIQTGGAGTVLVETDTGGITMTDGAEITTADGDIVVSTTTAGDVVVGRLNAGTGRIGVLSAGSILDGGDAGGADLTATEASLSADQAVGDTGDALDTELDTMEAQSVADGVYLNNTGAVSAGGLLAQPSANSVGTDGTLAGTVSPAVIGGLSAGDGIELTADNTITMDGPVTSGGTGDILLQTQTAGDIDLNALVNAAGGSLSIQAVDNVNLNVAGPNAAAASSLEIDAAAGSVTMVAGSSVSTGGGTINVTAGNDAMLGGLDSAGGDVNLDAGNLLTLNGPVTSGGGAVTGTAVGTISAADTIDTVGGDLGLNSSGGDVILQGAVATSGGAVTLESTTGAVDVQEDLNSGSGDIDVTAATSADFNSTGGGVTTSNATLTVAAANVSLQGAVDTMGGDIDLASDGTLTFVENVSAGTGTISLTSTSGDITQTGGAITGAGLAFDANGTVDLGQAGNDLGTVAGTADGSITLVDGGDLAVGTVGTTTGLVSNANDIDITAAGALTLAADVDAGTANLFLTSTAGDITQTGGAVTADELELVSGGAATLEAAGNDVNTLAGTAIGALSLVDGDDIVVGATTGQTGLSGDGVSVSTDGDLDVQAALASTGGDVSLSAGAGSITVVEAITTAGGSFTATGANFENSDQGADNGTITTAGGDVDITADAVGLIAGDILSGGAGNGTISIAAPSLTLDKVALDTGGAGPPIVIGGGYITKGKVDLLGDGTIVLNQDIPDLIIDNQTVDFGTEGGSLNARRDITVINGGSVVSAGSSNVLIQADSDGLINTNSLGAAYGGLFVDGSSAITSGGSLTLQGSDSLSNPGFAIRIDGDVSAGADLLIDGRVPVTGAQPETDVLIAGTATADNGVLEIRAQRTLTVEGTVETTTVGDITLDSLGDVVVNNDLTSAGNIVVASGGAVSSTGGTLTGGTIDLQAVDGIGTAADPLALAATTVDAVNSGAGAIGLTVENSVDATVTVGSLMTSGAIDLTQTGTANLLISTDLTSGGGNISIAAPNDLDLSATVATAGGDLALDAGNLLTLNGAVDTGGGAVDGTAGGTITAANTIDTVGGDLSLISSGGDVILQAAVATSGGAVTLESTTAAVDVQADLNSGSGAIDVTADTDVTINSVSGGLTTSNGTVTVAAGNDATFSGAAATGGGTVGVTAGNDISLAGVDTAGGDLNLDATNLLTLNGAVQTGGGAVDGNAGGTITAANTIDTLGGDLSLVSSGGDVILQADVATSGGAVTLESTAAAVDVQADLNSGSGSIDVTADTDVTINSVSGGLTTSNGTVTVAAGNDATFSGAAATGGGTVGVTAGNDISLAGVDTAGGDLNLDATNLLALNGTVSAGGGTVDGTAGGTITAANTIDTVGGDLSLVSSGGDVILQADVATSGGAVTLESTTAAVDVQADLNSGSGAIDVTADTEVTINSVSGGLTTSNGTVTVAAGNDAMLLGAVATGGGTVGVTAGNDINLATVDTAGGDLNLDATSLLTLNGTVSTGGGAVDGTAGGTITAANTIDTVGGDLSLVSSGGDVILQAAVATSGGSVTLESTTAAVDVQADLNSGSGAIDVTADTDVTINSVSGGLTTSNGTVTVAAGNDATLLGAVATGGGSVDVSAGNAAGLADVDTNGGDLDVIAVGNVGLASVSSDTGELDISAGGNILMTGSLRTVGAEADLSAGGTLDLQSTVDSAGGDVSLDAADSITVAGAVGGTDAVGEFVAISSGGDVVLSGDVTTDGSEVVAVATTGTVSLQGVTSAGGPVTLEAGTLVDLNGAVNTGGGELSSSGGAFDNTGGAITTAGGAVSLDHVGTTTVGGAISTAGGDVTIRGESLDTTGVIDTGAGSAADGGNIDIAMNDQVTIGAGLVSGAAGVDGGDISVVASNNTTMAAAGGLLVNGNLSSFDGAGGTLTIGGGSTLNGSVSVGAGDIFLNGGGLDLIINAAQNFNANTGLIALRDVVINNAVSTSNGGSLTIEADTDGLANTDGLGTALGGVLVQGAGTVSSSGSLVILGSELLNVGGAPSSVSLAGAANTVSATGNIRIEGKAAAPAGSGVNLSGAVTSTAGSITVLTAEDIEQNANLMAQGAGQTLDVESTAGSVLMAAGSASTAADGTIRYVADQDVILGSLDAGAGSVSVTAIGGSIRDFNGAGVNVVADQARFSAADAVGDLSLDDRLETQVNTVAAEAGAGGIGLEDADGVVVGSAAVATVNRVQTDGSTLAESDAGALAGHISTSDGHIVQLTSGGDLVVDEAVQAAGAGNVLLHNNGGAVALNNTVSSDSGSIQVQADTGVTQAAGGDIQTGGAGTILVRNGTGDIVMADGAEAITGGGDILYVGAASGVEVGSLNSASGRVGIESAGSILDAGDAGGADIVAAEASLSAAQAIGDAGNALDTEVDGLEAQASTGGLYVENNQAISVGPLAAQPTANVVAADGTMPGTSSTAAIGGLTSGDNLVLQAVDTIFVDGTVMSGGAGNLLLQTLGGGDIDVNAMVNATGGSLSIRAADNVNLNAVGQNAVADGTLDIEAAGGSITMVDGAIANTGGGNILLTAANDVTLGGIDAGAGTIGVTAGSGSILDGGDADPDLSASSASLSAGDAIGSGADAIDVVLAELAADAGSGGIFVESAGDLDIADVPAFAVNRVAGDGSTTSQGSGDVSGLTTAADGSIVATADAGDLTIESAVTAGGAGNVLLRTTTTGDVIVNQGVQSGTGNLTVQAAREIQQSVDGDLATTGGDLRVDAAAGPIFMFDGATSSSDGGNILVTADGDVLLGGLDAGSGSIHVGSANGNIVDGGDTDVDVVGAAASFSANSVGDVPGANPLETAVNTVAASAVTGISLVDADAITVGTVPAVSVDAVNPDGTVSTIIGPAVSGLATAADGSIIQQSVDGDLTVDAQITANGAGNVLLRTQTGGDVNLLGAGVSSGSGDITVNAANGIRQDAAGDISTAGGSIVVNARDGAITMADGAEATTTGAHILYTTTQDLTVGSLNASGGFVLVDAQGNILDGGDGARDIIADATQLLAGGSVATGADLLETEVATVSARAAADGIYLDNLGAVTIGDLGAYTVDIVNEDGSSSPLNDFAAGDLITTAGNGNVVLTATDTIVVTDGTIAPDGIGVSADGTGNILLSTAANGVFVDAGVESEDGSIYIVALEGDITQNPGGFVETGSGSIVLEADDGSILLTDTGGSRVRTAGGDIAVGALGDVTVAGIDAGSGHAHVIAVNGSIRSGSAGTHVTAATATLVGGTAVGDLPGTTPIVTAVDIVAAQAGAGGINLTDVDDVTVGDAPGATVDFVGPDGTVNDATTVGALAGESTIFGGSIVQQAQGTLTVDEQVAADGAGNVLLSSTGGNVVLNQAGVSSGQGSIQVSGSAVDQQAAGDLATGGTGSIQVDAGSGGISMADGATATTSGGGIVYQAAGGDIVLGGLDAGSGAAAVVASAGSILDGGDSDIDVSAVGVLLQAGAGATSVGTSQDALDLGASVLTARAGGGGMFLDNTGAVAISDVAVSAADVLANGTTGAGPAFSNSDLATGNDGSIVLTADNTISVFDGAFNTDGVGVDASGSGNVLLTATSGDLIVQSVVQSGTGNLSLDAAQMIQQSPTGDLATTGGTADVLAGTNVAMADGATVSTGGGNILISAGDDVVLGGLDAGTGLIHVNATSGSILDGGDAHPDLVASGASLVGGTAVGEVQGGNAIDTRVDTIAADAGAGGISLEDEDAVTVGSVPEVSVNRVGADGTTTVETSRAVAGHTSASDGSIIQSTLNGTLTVDNAVSAGGMGNVLLQAQGAGSDVSLSQAGVESAGGDISVLAANAVDQSAAGDLRTTGGTIDVEAFGGAITMADGTRSESGGGNIRYTSSGTITLGGLDAGTGEASVTSSGGSILDGGDTDLDVVASGTRLAAEGSIGTGTSHLDTALGTLAAWSNGEGMYISNQGAVDIHTVAPVLVNRVLTDGTTSPVQDVDPLSDLVTGNNGNIILVSDGTITVNDGVAGSLNLVGISANGAGNVLLQSTDGDVALRTKVVAGTGSISILAAGDMTQSLGAHIQTGGAGTIDVVAGAAITMENRSTATTQDGNIRYEAQQGVARLGGLIAGNANVLVKATGQIIGGGDAFAEVSAREVILESQDRIGDRIPPTGRVDLMVDTLAAQSGPGGNGIFVRELSAGGDMEIGSVTVSDIQRVGVDGGVVATGGQSMAGLATDGQGAIVALVDDGDLLVNSTVSAPGDDNILLAAGGAGRDVVLAADVHAGSGDLSIRGARSVIQLSGSVASDGGDVDIVGTAGNASQADGSRILSGGGNVRIEAADHVQIAAVNAGSGVVTVSAGQGDVTDNGDTDPDVVASALQIDAAGGTIGDSMNRLETVVSTVAAESARGIYVQNIGSLAVDTVGPVSVNRVGENALSSSIEYAARSDLATTDNGNIVLVADDTISVNDGSDPGDGFGIRANGFGNILLQADDGGSLVVNAGIRSDTGNLSLLAAGAVDQSTDAVLVTGGAGTVDVEAQGGGITMAAGAATTTAGGNIRLWADGPVTVADLDAESGQFSIGSDAGAITQAAGSQLVGSSARLQAAVGIGTETEPLATTVDTVAATTGSGGIFLTEEDGVVIGTVGPVTVNRVGTDGLAGTPVSDPTLVGMTAADGDIQVTSLNGDLTVAAPVTATTGKVLLESTGSSADLNIANTVTSGGSDVILESARDIHASAGVTANRDVALWADTGAAGIGNIAQTAGVIEAQQGHMWLAGNDIVQTGADSKFKVLNGTLTVNVNSDLHLGSTLVSGGVEAKSLVAGADNIIVDTLITVAETLVFRTDGSITHSPGNTTGKIVSQSIALRAGTSIGRDGNPDVDFLRVNSSFMGTFADEDEFIIEDDDTISAGPVLLLTDGFEYPYVDSESGNGIGPEEAELIPRPFEDVLEIAELFDGIEVDDILNIIVGGDLNGSAIVTGGDAIITVGGSVNLDLIDIGGSALDIDVGGDFNVGVFQASAVDLLDVKGNGNIGSFTVVNNATVRFGGNFSGNTMSVGGPLDLRVGGNWDYDSVTLGAANDTVVVNGNARVGSLQDDGNLRLDVGGGYVGGSLGVAGTLDATIGQDIRLDSLSAGTLQATVGGNGEIGTTVVSGDATAGFGGSFSGGSLDVGGATDLTIGGDWNHESVLFGGDALVMVDGSAAVADLLAQANLDATIGGDAAIDSLSVSRNLMAMIGGSLLDSSFDVGGDATLDIGGDWTADTAIVSGALGAVVGGSTTAAELTTGTMDLTSERADITTLTTSGDSLAVIGSDFLLQSADIGGEADWSTGGNLDVVDLSVNGSLLAQVDGTLTFDQMFAANVEIGAGAINLGQLETGSAVISAGGAISNNGGAINASSLNMTGGSIGSNGSIPLSVGTIQTVSGGGDVNITINGAGDNVTGLLRAGGTLIVNVPNGGLVDGNGDDLNIVSGGDSQFNAQYLGTVSDALEVDIGGNLFIDGAGLSGEDPDNLVRVFVNVTGNINGGGRQIQYIGNVSIPGLVFLNGQLLLGDQFLLLEVARTEAFLVETPEIKSPQGVFGDPYFIHLYMQISEAWNLFLDFILFGEAQVSADPEMPPDAKRTIKIGGTEKPYAR